MEKIDALPLMAKRRILGIAIPAVNLPLFLLNLYQTITLVQGGTPLNSLDFLNGFVISIISFLMCFGLPWWIPVYPSNYFFTDNGLKLTRFLKSPKVLPFKNIERVEAFIREDRSTSRRILC